jgi:CRP-like cAMP-binding protein
LANHDHVSRPRNRLLAALPPEDLLRFRPRLRPVALELRQILASPGERIAAVHFPESGYVSNIILLEEGGGAEVGLIGREGMTGLPLLHGVDRSPDRAMVQSPGRALRLDAPAFREALEESPALRRLLLLYAVGFQVQVAQTAACNAHHPTEQRLARWLLMAHDRSEGDAFPMTHDFLSLMLGVRRQGVTVAAGMLQKAGLIRYGRGQMEIADRPGLEAAACECHGSVRREYECLLGPAGLP